MPPTRIDRWARTPPYLTSDSLPFTKDNTPMQHPSPEGALPVNHPNLPNLQTRYRVYQPPGPIENGYPSPRRSGWCTGSWGTRIRSSSAGAGKQFDTSRRTHVVVFVSPCMVRFVLRRFGQGIPSPEVLPSKGLPSDAFIEARRAGGTASPYWRGLTTDAADSD